jgi:diguanylate cyclase (GGDEF)-like protein
MNKIFDYLSKRPKSQMAATAFSLVVLLGAIDYLTGPDLSVFIFYLIPVFLGTWFVGKWAGIALSVCSAATWSLADLMSFRMMSNAIIPTWNLATEVIFLLGAGYVLAMLKASLERAQEAARIDYLTGAATGRYFRELADRELDRMRRYDHPFTVTYLDLDNFKAVNDTFGHDAGDALLKQVVKTIGENIRSTDIIARMGGDEFVILFPETGAETANTALAKVREQLLRAMEQNRWPVTFSFGMVTFISPPESVDQAIRLTDKLMYTVKNSGKNTIEHTVFYGPKQKDLQT